MLYKKEHAVSDRKEQEQNRTIIDTIYDIFHNHDYLHWPKEGFLETCSCHNKHAQYTGKYNGSGRQQVSQEFFK